MKAFHNDPNIKQKYLDRLAAHAQADEIIKGIYWENGKGCAVGCTIHSSDHADYETELGIPIVLARLEDRIFEGLPNELAKTWPIRFLNAIPVGADLELIWPKFAHWLVVDPLHGVSRFNSHSTIQDVANLYKLWINGTKPTSEQWSAATGAAWAAAAKAPTDAAAEAAAAAAWAAEAVAWAKTWAPTWAADAAAVAAEAAAWAAEAWAPTKAEACEHYIVMSNKIIQLLEEME